MIACTQFQTACCDMIEFLVVFLFSAEIAILTIPEKSDTDPESADSLLTVIKQVYKS